ncbi:MAG: phage major capsid protein [Fibrobacter sp.]|nr:phage major capsid protein [Fibrobacter sp.]
MSISIYRGDITLPAEVSSEIMQKTQEASAVMQLARQIALPGRGLAIPVITGDPTAAWVEETNPKPVSTPGLSTKIMQAYKLAVIVPFSDEFRRDAAALYDELIARLPGALALKFDSTVFHGTAPGSNFDTFAAVTGQSISGSGDSPVYAALVAADTDVAVNGGILNGFAFSPQGKGELLSALDGDGRPIFVNSVAEGAVPRLLGSPVAYTKGAYKAGAAASGNDPAVPDVIGFAGDWTQAMYGTVEGVKVDISNQATLVDANSNTINLWQRNMFAVRAEIEVGFRADTACFNKITRTHV